MKTKCLYSDLKVGDLFSLDEPSVRIWEGRKFRKVKGDKRIYRKEKEGSLMIYDEEGGYVEKMNIKSYPYLTMTVYKIER